MRIRVTYDKIYNSDEFYEGESKEFLKSVVLRDFKPDIVDYIYDFTDNIIKELTFKVIEDEN